jgi:hypothetical protein
MTGAFFVLLEKRGLFYTRGFITFKGEMKKCSKG